MRAAAPWCSESSSSSESRASESNSTIVHQREPTSERSSTSESNSTSSNNITNSIPSLLAAAILSHYRAQGAQERWSQVLAATLGVHYAVAIYVRIQ